MKSNGKPVRFYDARFVSSRSMRRRAGGVEMCSLNKDDSHNFEGWNLKMHEILFNFSLACQVLRGLILNFIGNIFILR